MLLLTLSSKRQGRAAEPDILRGAIHNVPVSPEETGGCRAGSQTGLVSCTSTFFFSKTSPEAAELSVADPKNLLAFFICNNSKPTEHSCNN